MLSQIYDPDTDQECKENLRDLLELLHDGCVEEDAEQQASKDLKDHVYNVIKAFAEENPKAYQESNLIPLMNKVVQDRRGDIFEEEKTRQSIISNRSTGRSKENNTNSLFNKR